LLVSLATPDKLREVSPRRNSSKEPASNPSSNTSTKTTFFQLVSSSMTSISRMSRMITSRPRKLVKPSERILDSLSTTPTEIYPTPRKTKRQATLNSSSVD